MEETSQPKLSRRIAGKIRLAAKTSILIFTVLVIYYLWDAPKHDDTDLLHETQSILPQHNAYDYIRQALKTVHIPDDQAVFLEYMRYDASWADDVADALLASNVQVFDLLEKAARLERIQVPLNELGSFRQDDVAQAYRLLQLRLLKSWREERDSEAFDYAFDILELGHIICSSHCGVFDYVAGRTFKQVGFHLIRNMAVSTKLSDTELASVLARLQNYRTTPAMLSGVIRAEYAIHKSLKVPPLARIVYHPNRTQRMKANACRRAMIDIESPRTLQAIPLLLPSEDEFKSRRVVRPWQRNIMGQFMHESMLGSLDNLLQVKCGENVQFALTQTAIAMQLYQRENGELPESLDALVPRYLEHVPRDDFDGLPLRYRREIGIVYSIGYDCNDDGGTGDDMILCIGGYQALSNRLEARSSTCETSGRFVHMMTHTLPVENSPTLYGPIIVTADEQTTVGTAAGYTYVQNGSTRTYIPHPGIYLFDADSGLMEVLEEHHIAADSEEAALEQVNLLLAKQTEE